MGGIRGCWALGSRSYRQRHDSARLPLVDDRRTFARLPARTPCVPVKHGGGAARRGRDALLGCDACAAQLCVKSPDQLTIKPCSLPPLTRFSGTVSLDSPGAERWVDAREQRRELGHHARLLGEHHVW